MLWKSNVLQELKASGTLRYGKGVLTVTEGQAGFSEVSIKNIGSCAELITHVIIAERLKYISRKISDKLSQEVDEISKMIMSLIKKL